MIKREVEKKMLVSEEGTNWGRILKWGIIGIIIIVVVFLLNPIITVPAGYRGVRLSFGAVQAEPLTEGIHFIVPIQDKVINMDVRTQKYQADADAASKDLQSITTTVALNYHVDPSQASTIYQKIGIEYQDRVIAPAIEESVKAVTARYTAEELITKREEVKAQVEEEIKDRLSPYNLVAETTNIVNFQFSEQFDRAIESKVTAEQDSLTAQRLLEKVKFEAQQKIEQANGEAQAKLTIAEAEAKSIQLQGDALRNNPEVTQLRAIEKWNGILPIYMFGGSIPFVQIPTNTSG